MVTYRAADVIAACLDSLAEQSLRLREVLVIDNDSPDHTASVVQSWIDQAPATAPTFRLIETGLNGGFAFGVNIGLRIAQRDPEAGLFWILNPDCCAAAGAAQAFQNMADAHPEFALMGGRTVFPVPGDPIQSDAGRVWPWTAVCRNVNQGKPAHDTPPPVDQPDFLSGANMVASRLFVERAGPMEEDYFLYYEEVDWAFRRGKLPLLICPDALVRHVGGTAAGSATLDRQPSAFSNYFIYRNRLRFALRHMPWALPGAYVHSIAKIAQLVLMGARAGALGAFLGLHQLPPNKTIRAALSSSAARVAFERTKVNTPQHS